jgi:hypothetical protein
VIVHACAGGPCQVAQFFPALRKRAIIQRIRHERICDLSEKNDGLSSLFDVTFARRRRPRKRSFTPRPGSLRAMPRRFETLIKAVVSGPSSPFKILADEAQRRFDNPDSAPPQRYAVIDIRGIRLKCAVKVFPRTTLKPASDMRSCLGSVKACRSPRIRGTYHDPLLTFTIRYFTLIRSRTP